MSLAVWMGALLSIAMALDCNYYSQLSQQYQCSSNSYLTSFLLPQCNKLSPSQSPKLRSLVDCVQQQVQRTVAMVTTKYNIKLDCTDGSVATAAYLQCLSSDPLKSFCEASGDDWYELLATGYQTNSVLLWNQITLNFVGIDSDTIKTMSQQESTDPGALTSFIDNWISNVSKPAEQLCSRHATLRLLHTLQGKYQQLANSISAEPTLMDRTVVYRSSPGLQLPADCQNYTNTTIENRQNEQIYISNCAQVNFSNVTFRNNVNLRIRVNSVGSLSLDQIRMTNNSGLQWRLSTIGKANFTRITVTNNNQDKSDPEAPYRRSLFTINSMSLQLSELQVKNYSGASIISLYDGTLFLTDCWFQNIAIDSVYSWGGVIDLRRGTIMLIGSEFRNVTAGTGGGLYLRDGSANINSCRFQNMQVQRGGGVYLTYGSLAVSESDFRGSKAQTGAAIYSSFSSVALTRITVANCTSNNGNLVFVNSTVNITQSQIDNNTAVRGAGIYSYSNNLLVDNANLFNSNSAEQTSAVGCFLGSVSLTNNNLFKNNHQSSGASPVGVQFGSATVDSTNQIEDDSQSACCENCGICKISASTLQPVCTMCLLPYNLIDEHTCQAGSGGNPAWFIVLIVLVFIGLGVGGFFFYRRFQRQRARMAYNQLSP